MEKPVVKISVRSMVEFILRSGDIQTGFVSNQRAVEGTKAHRKLQKRGGEDYSAEVALVYTHEYENCLVTVEGRADGIIQNEAGVVIDEIKTVTAPMEVIDENYNPLHWAQAKCYAFIYAEQNEMEEIGVQLTYYHIDTEEIKLLQQNYTLDELRQFFFTLLDSYSVWAEYTCNWTKQRNLSIKELGFPFVAYRKGQREMAVAVYRTITENKKLFVQAPTGIGKTISTLFPAVKAMGEGVGQKIFYLTARTITRQVAEEAFSKMAGLGLRCKNITLTAKDKICAQPGAGCNPEECEFARGHLDRINGALLDVLTQEEALTREIIEAYARKHRVCPFEFSLDLALWADCIICDYNYVFDPRVYLKRFFMDNGGEYTFLVDEAHNLVDRAREMFSSELSKRSFMDIRKELKRAAPKLYKIVGDVNKYFIEIRKSHDGQKVQISSEEPKELYKLLKEFMKECEAFLSKSRGMEVHEGLLDLYFECLAFARISEFFDERYVVYITYEERDVRIKLFCLDPSFWLKEALKRGSTAVFFSATLTPLDYFREILGGEPEDYSMRLASPFDRNNLCLLVANNISTKYKDRQNSYWQVAEYIKALTLQKTGNYLVFFPSFEYMREVSTLYSESFPEDETLIQESMMTEEDREAFLKRFMPDCSRTLIGFAVMGGIFSEGVDLAGERLSGAVIVGVGLPQMSPERDIIMEYFKNKNGQGYEFAYMYPGMNKVLQAAGRVIRTEQDRGTVFLIDDRFLHRRYLELFPKEWDSYIKVSGVESVTRNLRRFWSSH